jgi:hypothetical protein
MTKNVEKLAKLGEFYLQSDFKFSLTNIKCTLEYIQNISKNTDTYDRHKSDLNSWVKYLKRTVESVKENYDVEFPELEAEYEKLLPEINKHLSGIIK